ncbi:MULTISPECIES: GNAT family N-acetyltransferase [Flavobacterium]|uniref:N-acetyltransferase n=2 Tax=Flavobacterium TaxID=237 RepID=A0A2N9PBY0_9FLAO|nr:MULTISPECIES: GNAT family N-acetyltransferase [Flavobacterium]QYS89335.1 GNAT family N-acetyltransferase [Flavobacterium davisii]RVU90543.1 N-acetyltransferase [Flavobacterium columnare]SPE77813.1 hypothetical protein FLACOL_01823 [Flavobacterium columnare]
MTTNIEIKKKTKLTKQEKIQLFNLWNNEYPEKLTYDNLTEFDKYLFQLKNKNHYLLTSIDLFILGWAITFERENEKWFALILSQKIQGKGLGKKILDELKKHEQSLNGWVIDHHDDKKKNGDQYISPLKFYEKCGFKIFIDERLELDKISAVRIRWQSKTSY